MTTLAPLAPERLRRMIDPATLGIETTAELAPLDSIIGQQRAVSALQFGLGMREAGFNIYVAGEPGIGKMTAVCAFLEAVASQQPTPSAWCYVNNFADPSQPVAIRLPMARVRAFQQDVKRFVTQMRSDIPKAFESEGYVAQRDELGKQLDQRRNALLSELRAKARESGVAVQMTPYGVMTLPLLNGEPVPEQAFDALTQAQKDELKQHNEDFQEHVRAMMKQGRAIEREAQEQLAALDKQVAHFVVGGSMDDLSEGYADLPDVVTYLHAMQADILDNIELFRTPPNASEDGSKPPPWVRDLPFRKYDVNVLMEDGARTGAPVVVEANASYPNLFGRIEKESQFGALYTDFTMIKAGALHRANGGYLVLSIEDVLRNTFTWDSLKRALRSRELRIEDPSEQFGYMSTKTLQPQALRLNVKIVLVGRPSIYDLLCAYDEDFAELFKVKADFDTQMARDATNTRHFLQFVHTLCRAEGLRHVDSAAAAKLLEYAARLTEDQDKLSTHFGTLADVVREANHWAEQDQTPCIDATHVQQALDQRVYRANLIQERLQEMIARGQLLIDMTHATVGQVNGLSVLSLGDFAFGKPSRITASVEPGRVGILDIEREVALGGPIHSKGVLILSGYLAHRYGLDKPIVLAARLVFEQSYSGVEGDSASSAELYALLSALAGLPIQQSIAVTGSVNQHGEVQAIGGVNEKIEGFFDVCKSSVGGLTGAQGVLIPASNTQNLMLREDVVATVKAGQFNIWAVRTIDEGIEILTGAPAGEREAGGSFPAGSVNARVDARLGTLAKQLKAALEPEKLEKVDWRNRNVKAMKSY
jgi:lon-related putative ATP-dependent protease